MTVIFKKLQVMKRLGGSVEWKMELRRVTCRIERQSTAGVIGWCAR